jgi:hypothetical protein
MVATASRSPLQTDGSRSIAVASWNIRNGCNGGLESTLQAIEAMSVDLGVFLETSLRAGYTLGIQVDTLSSCPTPPARTKVELHFSGRPTKMYEVQDWRICRPNVLSFVVVMGSQRYYVVGCYIPPTNLSTLPQVEQALNKCPKGHTPLHIGDLNVNLCAARDGRDERIAEVAEDIWGLTDLSKHFLQKSHGHMRRRLTWRIRRGRRWVTSQCDYSLGRATDHRKFCSIRLRTPYNHDSDHRAIITKIHVASATKMTAYWKGLAKFPIRLPRGPQDELTTLFEELCLDVMALPTQAQSCNQWISAHTWALINKRAAPRQQGKLSQRATHLIGRQIAAGLKGDRAKGAAAAVEKIEGHLVAGEPKEA